MTAVKGSEPYVKGSRPYVKGAGPDRTTPPHAPQFDAAGLLFVAALLAFCFIVAAVAS
jgi:hypothetical protein